jgi:hypothetical protein
LIALSSAGCGEDEGVAGDRSQTKSSSQTFAGALNDTDAMVAAVQSGRDWLFYVCGGETTQATLTGWFPARVDHSAGTANVEATDGEATIVATRGIESISGTLRDSTGAVYSFEADRVDVPAAKIAGLYSTMDSGCRTGLVVVPNLTGDPMRVQGVWCDSGGRVGQVTPISPIELDHRGLAVLAGPDSRLLHLLPAIPPLP